MFARNKLLFFDPSFIKASRSDTSLTVCPPMERHTAFCREYPWENFIHPYTSFMYDEQVGEYRIYYGARDNRNRSYLALAVSRDSIAWEKPMLGLFDYDGSKENNLVGLPFGDGTVFIDKHAPDAERYKYIVHFKEQGLFVYTSPDGIHWDADRRTLLSETFNDGQNVAFWDESIGKYRLYLRGWELEPHLKRIAVTCERDSLSEPLWNVPPTTLRRRNDSEQPVITAKELTLARRHEATYTQICTFPVTPYPGDGGYYAAFAGMIFCLPGSKDSDELSADGFVETTFCASSNGVKFHRYSNETYIANEPCGMYQNNMSYVGTGIIAQTDRMLACGVLYRCRNGETERRLREGDGTVMLYGQRPDGYVALQVRSKRRKGVVRRFRAVPRFAPELRCGGKRLDTLQYRCGRYGILR